MQETWVPPLGQEDPPEKGMTIHSSNSCLENPMNRGAQQATTYGVIKSWKQLKRLVQNWERSISRLYIVTLLI